MAQKLNPPIFIYTNRQGKTELYWPHAAYNKDYKLVILKGLKEMARWSKELAVIKKFEDWKKDPGFKV